MARNSTKRKSPAPRQTRRKNLLPDEYKREGLVTVEMDAIQAALFAPKKLEQLNQDRPGVFMQQRSSVIEENTSSRSTAWAARQLSTTGPVTPKCRICGFGIGSASLFPDRETFYSAGTNRRESEEFDYGFHWRQGTDLTDRWRVSYIRTTGEVYATREYRPLVVVLGVVPPDEAEGGPYYRTLEHILDGWADHCGKPGGLEWVRDRLAMYPHGRAAEVSNANNQ